MDQNTQLSATNKTPFVIKAINREYKGLTRDLEGKWNGSFSFIQAADTQFGLIDQYIYKKDGTDWSKEIYYLKLAIESINKITPKPKFMVICGDLANAFPSLPELRSAQVVDLKKVLSELDPEIKLVCVCGNHDVGDIPSRESIEVYKKDFGDDHFSFWCNGCKFIVLNSQLYYESSLVPELRVSQDEWLQKELDDVNERKHLVIFQHIPLFIVNPDEPKDKYFNLDLDTRKNLLDRLVKAGVKKVFCGHYHRNAGGFYGDLECVVTSAIGAQIGNDKHGYRLVKVDENQINHEYIAISDQVN